MYRVSGKPGYPGLSFIGMITILNRHFFGAGGAFLTSSERKGEERRELSKASDPLMLFF